MRDLEPINPLAEAFAADLLGLIRGSPASRLRHELEEVVLRCSDPGLLGASTREFLGGLVSSIRPMPRPSTGSPTE